MTRQRKPEHLSRRFPYKYVGRPLVAHAKLTGEVVWAWNALQSQLAAAFAFLLHPTRIGLGFSIWAAIPSDRAQRAALVAAVKEALPARSKRRGRLLWAVEQAEKLAMHRNDVIHSWGGYYAGPGGMLPSNIGSPEARVRRLESVGTRSLMTALTGDLLQLSVYVARLALEDGRSDAKPIPQKPRLRTLRLKRSPARPDWWL
jgi:hypothetical protein